MNRKPTTPEQALAWHTAALAHLSQPGNTARGGPPISENEPQVGWYMRRLIQKGPFVPCRIWIEPGEVDPETGELLSPEIMRCEVDGARRNDVVAEWTWLCGKPISEDKFMDMIAGAFAGAGPVDEPEIKPSEIITENITPGAETYARRAVLLEDAPADLRAIAVKTEF